MKVLAWCWMATVVGCNTTRGVYSYQVVNDHCDCTLFHLTDEKAHVSYSFSGVYSVSGGMRTRLTLSIRNDNRDTLDLSLAYIRISSRNIPYRYNGKFLPVTIASIPPGRVDSLSLDGEVDDTGGNDPWLAIAGEELVLTIEGMRIEGRSLATQVVRFVPQNPKLSLSSR